MEQDDNEEENDEERPPFIYDVETLHAALGKAAQDPDTYSPNRKKLAELEKRFKDLIPGDDGSGDEEEEEDDDEAPTLVDDLEEEEEEENLEEDDESARKSGWINEFTAGDLIAHELKEDAKPKERKKKDNGLLGGKMVSIDASTLDISGLETQIPSSEEPKPKKSKKKSKKHTEEPVELVEPIEPENIEESEEILTTVSEDGQSTTTKVTKKKKVQWVLDQNTIRSKNHFFVAATAYEIITV
jgi:hypothetical protein